MNYRVQTVQAVAWLDQELVQLKLTGEVGTQVTQTTGYLLTPEQARSLAATLTDFAKLTEPPRES